jgi:hypothetical protein
VRIYFAFLIAVLLVIAAVLIAMTPKAAKAADAQKFGDVSPEISTEGLMRENKMDVFVFAGELSPFVGMNCMDALLAVRAKNLLSEGKTVEANELRWSKAGRVGCEDYNERVILDFAPPKGEILFGVCHPFDKPNDCRFVTVPQEIPK